MRNGNCTLYVLLALIAVYGLTGCQRDNPGEKALPPQPVSGVDRAAQQAVDAMQAPMDKARAVESTLGQAAERMADTTSDTSR